MFSRIKTYLLYGNRFCGIEHTIKNNETTFFASLLRQHKKELYIEKTLEELSIEALVKKLPKKQPVFLIINDNNIITKSISAVKPNLDNLVYSAFPNIEIDNFYYEIISQDDLHFVSICRKAYIDTLIAKYKDAGITIMSLFLGQNIITNSLPFIKKNVFFTSNALITSKNQSIQTIEKKEVIEAENYDVNGLEINNNYLLSLSGALETVVQNHESTTNYNTLKLALKDDFFQSKFFQQFLKFSLISILAILLVNFIFFNYYFNKVNALQQTSQVNQSSKAQLLKLNEAVGKSQKMVEDMLKGSSSRSSFYTNIVVKSLPETILLSELNYQPILKRIKADQPIEQDVNVILVSGTSNNSEAFSEWIANLEDTDEINNVEIQHYEDFSK